MAVNPLTHKDFLNDLGTRPILARELNRSYHTVDSWIKRDSIPHWEWDNIAALARKQGKRHITYRTLKAAAAARRRVATQASLHAP